MNKILSLCLASGDKQLSFKLESSYRSGFRGWLLACNFWSCGGPFRTTPGSRKVAWLGESLKSTLSAVILFQGISLTFFMLLGGAWYDGNNPDKLEYNHYHYGPIGTGTATQRTPSSVVEVLLSWPFAPRIIPLSCGSIWWCSSLDKEVPKKTCRWFAKLVHPFYPPVISHSYGKLSIYRWFTMIYLIKWILNGDFP